MGDGTLSFSLTKRIKKILSNFFFFFFSRFRSRSFVSKELIENYDYRIFFFLFLALDAGDVQGHSKIGSIENGYRVLREEFALFEK